MVEGVVFKDSNIMVKTETPNSVVQESPSLSHIVELMLMQTSSESIDDRIKLHEPSCNLLPLRLKLAKHVCNAIEDTLCSQQNSLITTGNNINNYNQNKDKGLKKATKCDATLLKIGSWQRVATYNEDLVVKLYCAKRKLVWEILERGLKKKIEVSWDSILAMRVVTEENQPGILEVELSQVPSFYEEKDPQPRRHTSWSVTQDFTHGQASVCRRHYIQFAPGVFDRYYERLLQCESRFVIMRQCPFPSQQSPYFHPSFQYITSIDFNGSFREEFNPFQSNQVYQPPLLSQDSPLLEPLQVYQQPLLLEDSTSLEPFQEYQPPLLSEDSTSTSQDDDFMMNIDGIINGIDMALWDPQLSNNIYYEEVAQKDENQGAFSNPITVSPHQNNCDSGNHFLSYSTENNGATDIYNTQMLSYSNAENIGVPNTQMGSYSNFGRTCTTDTQIWSTFPTFETTGANTSTPYSRITGASTQMWRNSTNSGYTPNF